MMPQLKDGLLVCAAAFMALLAQSAKADPLPIGPNLITNGDFSQTTMPNGPSQIYSSATGTQAQLETTSNLTGWGTTGYNFIYASASASSVTDGTNTYSSQSLNYGPTALWSPGSPGGGAANGFVNPPNGGNFIGADGAFQVGTITQTLTNLKIGENYMVQFQWAAAQQQGFTGSTTESWTVSLGDQSFSTQTYQNASHGFSGWMTQSFVFSATAATEALAFLAQGTPSGEPPFSLLANVGAYDVPEPATLALLAAGLGCLAVSRARKRAV